ncbi:hypothetical protein ACFLQ1_00370 [Candidatus Auribacterota bacterium]
MLNTENRAKIILRIIVRLGERDYIMDNDKEKKEKSLLLGLGMDNEDDHKRITQGEDFCLYGGSAKTHDLMVEEVLLFNEILKTTGKNLSDLSQLEYYEIVREVKRRKQFKSTWVYNFNTSNYLNN